MNNSFSVEKKVFEVLPDYCVGVIRASIPNKEGAANFNGSFISLKVLR